MKESIEKVYGNRLRLRVCGILQSGNSFLLVKHTFGEKGELWIPPGGEVKFGEKVEDALTREYLEETGLKVVPGELAFVYEYINEPYHAVELFYLIEEYSGDLIKGSDPETRDQIIEEVRYVTFNEIELMDKKVMHGIFSLVKRAEDITRLNGFYRAPSL